MSIHACPGRFFGCWKHPRTHFKHIVNSPGKKLVENTVFVQHCPMLEHTQSTMLESKYTSYARQNCSEAWHIHYSKGPHLETSPPNGPWSDSRSCHRLPSAWWVTLQWSEDDSTRPPYLRVNHKLFMDIHGMGWVISKCGSGCFSIARDTPKIIHF